jgi:hypothetical protein
VHLAQPNMTAFLADYLIAQSNQQSNEIATTSLWQPGHEQQ